MEYVTMPFHVLYYVYCIDVWLWRADFIVLNKSVPNKARFSSYTLDHFHLYIYVRVVSYINNVPVLVLCNLTMLP